MIEIRTKRLIIRDHILEDLNNLHNLLSNKKTMFYLPEIRTKSISESKENLMSAIEEVNSANREKFFLAIIDEETNEYIGEIGIMKVLNCSEGNVMNLGYFIKESFWGRGIVTEAAEAIISYAFTNLKTFKIETGCIVNNKGSERVMQKLKMTKEADFKRHVLLEDKIYDRVEYRVMIEEWKDRLNASV